MFEFSSLRWKDETMKLMAQKLKKKVFHSHFDFCKGPVHSLLINKSMWISLSNWEVTSYIAFQKWEVTFVGLHEDIFSLTHNLNKSQLTSCFFFLLTRRLQKLLFVFLSLKFKTSSCLCKHFKTKFTQDYLRLLPRRYIIS